MATIKERRETASKLRLTHVRNANSFGGQCMRLQLEQLANDILNCIPGKAPALLELADLIDPGDGHFRDSAKMVDIDALLELVEDLEKESNDIMEAAKRSQHNGNRPSMLEAKSEVWRNTKIIRRIREALCE